MSVGQRSPAGVTLHVTLGTPVPTGCVWCWSAHGARSGNAVGAHRVLISTQRRGFVCVPLGLRLTRRHLPQPPRAPRARAAVRRRARAPCSRPAAAPLPGGGGLAPPRLLPPSSGAGGAPQPAALPGVPPVRRSPRHQPGPVQSAGTSAPRGVALQPPRARGTVGKAGDVRAPPGGRAG